MKKYELSVIGEFHTNHNEDFCVTSQIGNNKIMIAVMDGCSMGTESHFSSILIGKLLRKISKEEHYLEFLTKGEHSLKSLLEKCLKKVFEDLTDLKSRLDLEIDELLSTLILGVVDVSHRNCELIVIGDGVVCNNGVITEFEQDNKPDYLGYHLNKNFKKWYNEQNQFLSLNNIRNLSIATDGVFTFKKFDNKNYQTIDEEELLNLLLNDNTHRENEKMLLKKVIEIEKKWGLKPSDDLTIIRLIFD